MNEQYNELYNNNNWIKIDALLANSFLGLILNSSELTSTKAVYPQSQVIHIADSPQAVFNKLTELYSLLPAKFGYNKSNCVKEAYPANVFKTGSQHDKIVAKKIEAENPKTTIKVVQELSDLADSVKTQKGAKEVCNEFNKNKKWYEV